MFDDYFPLSKYPIPQVAPLRNAMSKFMSLMEQNDRKLSHGKSGQGYGIKSVILSMVILAIMEIP